MFTHLGRVLSILGLAIAPALAAAAGAILSSGIVEAADAPTAFTGEKTAWHGFDRHDFLMDEQSLARAVLPRAVQVDGERCPKAGIVTTAAKTAANFQPLTMVTSWEPPATCTRIVPPGRPPKQGPAPMPWHFHEGWCRGRAVGSPDRAPVVCPPDGTHL
jgi:hypothetical protein